MTSIATPKRIAFTMLATVVVSMCAQASAQPHRKHIAREEVEAMEQQWRAAELSDDAAAMDRLLSDDYLGITGNGDVVTKLQQLDHMRTRALNISKLDISDVKIKLVDHIAIVTSLAQIDGMIEGAPLRGNYRSTRVYQRLPTGVWKLTNFEATRIKHQGNPQNAAAVVPTPQNLSVKQ